MAKTYTFTGYITGTTIYNPNAVDCTYHLTVDIKAPNGEQFGSMGISTSGTIKAGETLTLNESTYTNETESSVKSYGFSVSTNGEITSDYTLSCTLTCYLSATGYDNSTTLTKTFNMSMENS